MDIARALARNYAGTKWILSGTDYSGLEWLDELPKPTETELEALWPTVQYEVAYEQTEQARALAYQQTADPLFFQYQRGTATEQEWLDAVQAVKDAHPYPEDVTTDETQ
jgi:hypothetical protein